jgi:hypothetical protein
MKCESSRVTSDDEERHEMIHQVHKYNLAVQPGPRPGTPPAQDPHDPSSPTSRTRMPPQWAARPTVLMPQC